MAGTPLAWPPLSASGETYAAGLGDALCKGDIHTEKAAICTNS